MRTHTSSNRFPALLLVLAALALLLSACNPLGDEEAQASADDLVAQIPLPDGEKAQVDETFVGLTENGIGIGIVVNGGAAVAYICDGRALGHWLKGNVDDDQLDLTHAAGTRLDAELANGAITGTVTLSDGETLAFTATPAVKQGSGLFRSTELQEGFVFGWIVLVDDDGLVTVRGLGQNSKTKAIDGEISTDVMDPNMDFGVPGADGIMSPDMDFGLPKGDSVMDPSSDFGKPGEEGVMNPDSDFGAPWEDAALDGDKPVPGIGLIILPEQVTWEQVAIWNDLGWDASHLIDVM